ncbi:asparagine synthase (glutamine-hydrolyzing) [Altererythrobacter sediminis]|uniref:asparagine synthase (glutamine-hydrolyzing) n=2 Tax=Allopontixanthobacter sediminis TaxID=1689985 RepID=A0A845B2I1_9SPHN|nr:asparagine synthase (glutamine-hydrolyzing) [Allopontixanthobacter sediminis]
MCGFVGFLRPSGLSADAEALTASMAARIRHRGPDDYGYWGDAEAGIAFGHRRLSIIDLSQAGHQPMLSASGRFVIAYNGEIYNFQELRAELEAVGAAPAWRGHSDTEVLLAAIDHWGIAATLPRLNGMFAFALWDRKLRRLVLARDRIGEKPLYYGKAGNDLLFGSELKALSVYPSFERKVSHDALHLFLRHNYIPGPMSIWDGIAKLEPGHWLDWAPGEDLVSQPYWSMADMVASAKANPITDLSRASEDLEELLADAIRIRMEADVPLGAFLSGGIDSSLIVALMQSQSRRPVKTFTIGYSEKGYDEAPYARKIAQHLGTDHHEMYISPDDGLKAISRLASVWDEPFSDSSQIPTLLVSELTRQHVTVSLSGDAGDEIFGGYHRYFIGMQIWGLSSALPYPLRNGMARLANSRIAGHLMNGLSAVAPPLRKRLLADRLPKVAAILSERSEMSFYRNLVSHHTMPQDILVDQAIPSKNAFDADLPFTDFRETMMYLDTLTYLPDDILTKVDRASMAASLESRVPFLDPRVMEFAWRLPMKAKISGGVGKRILREILYRHVPKELIERPKMGFAVPIDHWLRHELRDWAEALLDEKRLREEGFFKPEVVRKMWDEHQSGQYRRHYLLWDILMFQTWMDEHGRAPTAAPSALQWDGMRARA